MEIVKTNINGLFIIKPNKIEDSRGYFFESYKYNLIEKKIGNFNFVQENQSQSNRNILRGLHFQCPPFDQTKLVRVVKGSVIDVAVDLRKSSKTFGHHFKITLSDLNMNQLFVPRGFAHGFLVTSETAIVQYKVDNYYNKESESGLRFNDDILKIDWGLGHKKIITNKKDLLYESFNEFNSPF